MKSEDLKEGIILKSTVESYGSYDCTLKVTEVRNFEFKFEILKLGDNSRNFADEGLNMLGTLCDIDKGYYIHINKKVKRLS